MPKKDTLYITEDLYKDFENLHEYLCTIEESHLDDRGREIPNPKPHMIDLDLGRPLTLAEQIKRLFRQNLSEQMVRQGQESFQEANDFDIPEERGNFPDNSKYTVMEDEWLQMDPTSNSRNDTSPSKETGGTPSSGEAEDQAPASE